MAGALDIFVKNVMANTETRSWNTLAQLCRKSLTDILEKNVAHLDVVLEALNPESHTIPVIAILLSKMNQSWLVAPRKIFDTTLTQIEVMLPSFDRKRITFVIDLYVCLFHKVHQYCLLCEINEPQRAIALMSVAIKKLVKDTSVLTSLHSCLFALCLKARSFEIAKSFLHTGLTAVYNESVIESHPYMDAKWVLLYFYYGGLVFGAIGSFEEFFAMMRRALCLPASLPSYIMIQAYKKYVILSIMLYEKVVPLPSYRSVIIPRAVVPLCAEYIGLERVYMCSTDGTDKAGDVLKYLESHREVFENDKNVGLVKRLVRSIREASVVNLAKCFVSLSITDVVRHCHLRDVEHAMQYLGDMNDKKKLKIQIDSKTKIVQLQEIVPQPDERHLKKCTRKLADLSALLKIYDEEARKNPVYVNRILRHAACTRIGAVPSDEGIGYSPFMSFSFGNEPGTSREPDILE